MEDELAYRMHLSVSSESDDDHKENLDEEYEALKPPIRQFNCSDIIKVRPPSPENAWKKRQQQDTLSNTEQQTAAVNIECFSLPNLLDNNISVLSSSRKKKKKKQKNSSNSANNALQASVISETKCDNSVTFTAPSKGTLIRKIPNDNMLKEHNELVHNGTVSTTLKLSTYNTESSYFVPIQKNESSYFVPIQKNVASTSSTNNILTPRTSTVLKNTGSKKNKRNKNLANTNNGNNLASINVQGKDLRRLTMQMLQKSINMAKNVIHLDHDELRQLIQDSFPKVRKIVSTEIAKQHPTKEALYDSITKTILKKGLIYRGFILPVEIGENGHLQAVNPKLNKNVSGIPALFKHNHGHQHCSVAHTTQNKPEQLSKHMDKLTKTVAGNKNMHVKKAAVMRNEGHTIKNEKKTANCQIRMDTSTNEKVKMLQTEQSLMAEGVNISETSITQYIPNISMEYFENLMCTKGQNIKSTPKNIQKDGILNVQISNNATPMVVHDKSTEGIQHSHNMAQNNLDSWPIFGDLFKEGAKNLTTNEEYKLKQLAPESFNRPNQSSERVTNVTNTLGNSDFENLNINFEHNVEGGITLIETDKVDVISSDVIPQNDNKNNINGDDANPKKKKKKRRQKNKTPNLDDLEPLSEVDNTIKEKMATPPIIHIDVSSIIEASKNDEILANEIRRYSEKELLEINDLQNSKGYVLDSNIKIPESISLNNNKKCKTPKQTKSQSITSIAVQTDIAIPPIEHFFFPFHETSENLAGDEDRTSTSNENVMLTKEKNGHIEHETLFDKVINLVLIFVCVELMKSFLNNWLCIIFIFIFKFAMVLLALLGFYICLN